MHLDHTRECFVTSSGIQMMIGDVVKIDKIHVHIMIPFYSSKTDYSFAEPLGCLCVNMPLLVLEFDNWAVKVLTPDSRIGWLKRYYLDPKWPQ